MTIKILIIDDNEKDIKIMKHQLANSGYENIVTALTGEKGIETAKKENPDITIIDTVLPGIDGFEVCRQIKNDDSLQTKAIIITGKIRAVDALEARSAGADEYTVKAYDFQPLVNAINNIANEYPPADKESYRRCPAI
ncbi:MAG: response regulator [Elusimicrobia bacterium]|jgi:DNA-binding response OmpR family regulator|nr:response regulator [Elusimicrobiota bacterium]